MHVLLLLLILFQTAPLQQTRAVWVGHDSAIVQWEQTVPATVCVNRHSTLGETILIACINTEPGWHTLPVPITLSSVDGKYRPKPGDYFTLTLWQNVRYLGTFGPYQLQSVAWMPFRGPPPS